jgi:hypothetical protein
MSRLDADWRLWIYRFAVVSMLVLAVGCTAAQMALPTARVAEATQDSSLSSASGSTLPTLTPFQPLPAGTRLASDLPGAPTVAPSPTAELMAETAAPQETTTSALQDTPPPEETPTLSPSTPPAVFSLWIDPSLPAALLKTLKVPPVLGRVEASESALLRLEVGTQRPISQWVYALAAPFPTVTDGVSSELLKRAWSGEAIGPFAGQPLFMEESTREVFSALWGQPAPQAVVVLPAQELLDNAWKLTPSWAILPFESLEPRWKVLEVDGQSPLHKDFDPTAYALNLPVSLDGDPVLAETILSAYGQTLVQPTNRDPQRLTTLAMTGTTALVRATAYAMERKGITYPAKDIGDWLRQADLTHISNEVAFAEDCPYPDPLQPDMRFCSDPRYIGLLEAVGTDIVELTGDHFQDWGVEAMKTTLQLYQERGWPYYGGGANLEEGRKALTLEHNGNRLAFIGCNAKGGSYAQASAHHPGAVPCDFDWMKSEVKRLRDEGYLPIVTFQHHEYYTYQAQPDQERDFRSMAQAGAAIVSGSQSHQPQAMEFLAGAFIHYGLGNLFFDQYDVSPATRQAFIDRHVFYAGRYIGTDLLTIQFVDYARPRLMTPAERLDLLQAVFGASGW